MAPAALSRVRALQRLVLSSYVAPDQVGTAGLLAELRKLTALTMLVLGEGPLEVPLDAGAAAAYASLTASSNLQALTIQEAHRHEGAWQHVFGADKLPRLQSLVLKLRDPDIWGKPSTAAGELKAEAMTADDVAGLAASCPGLTSLVLKGVYQPGTPLAPLLSRLTALQWLDVRHASDADASVLPQLPQLQGLVLAKSSLSTEGVLQLTQLTQLTHLDLHMPGEEAEGGRTYGETLRLTSKAPAGAPPDVVSQLVADRERRKDPEAMKAWKLKQQQEGEAWLDQLFGRGRSSAAAAARQQQRLTGRQGMMTAVSVRQTVTVEAARQAAHSSESRLALVGRFGGGCFLPSLSK